VTDVAAGTRNGEVLVERIQQLETALQTRVVIEQAKGVLAGRHGVDMGTAFDVLRQAARTTQQRLHHLARRVVDEPETPGEIRDRLARRAAGG
jgi:AmiR/NasT family two-component response regulator